MEDYSKYLIKDYKYWKVQIHQNQSYLGRCIVWCKRKDALDLPDATTEEREELFIILKDLEQVILTLFKPDILNYAFLGNETHHLHGHVIPRYSKPVEFEGINFTDKNWGHNYQTDKDFVTPSEVLEIIKLKLQEELN
jgi:diadenosine tetraphosphate (Ap4A) HIT family hydrolase